MVGGQAIDLANEGKSLSIAEIENMHLHKQGALICSCITLVASLKLTPNDAEYRHLKHYENVLGWPFKYKMIFSMKPHQPKRLEKLKARINRPINRLTPPF